MSREGWAGTQCFMSSTQGLNSSLTLEKGPCFNQNGLPFTGYVWYVKARWLHRLGYGQLQTTWTKVSFSQVKRNPGQSSWTMLSEMQALAFSQGSCWILFLPFQEGRGVKKDLYQKSLAFLFLYFCLHFTGQSSVTWLFAGTNEAGKWLFADLFTQSGIKSLRKEEMGRT